MFCQALASAIQNPNFSQECRVHSFLETLTFAPLSTRQEMLKWSDDFPLVFQHHAVELALEKWLSRLKHRTFPSKENQPLLMTSAPTGSSKTIFLRLLCQLFRHQWDADKFIDSLCVNEVFEAGERTQDDRALTSSFANSISSSKAVWIEEIRQNIENIKNSKRITKLISSGELFQSFLTSTHPCFITFGSSSPITELEMELLGDSPKHMLLARIIFSELQPVNPTSISWSFDYDQFLSQHGITLRQLPSSLHLVVNFIKKKSGCNHFMLAIDDVLLLDGELEQILKQHEQALDDATTSGNRGPTFPPAIYFSTPRAHQILRAVGLTVIGDPRFAAIISSPVTSPLNDYVYDSRHDPVLVPLHPFIENLARLGDIIVERRGDSESLSPVMKMLSSTGGHPELLFKIIPWLSDPNLPCTDMTLTKAAEKCHVDQAGLYERGIAQAILTGDRASPYMVALTCGLRGILTRPKSLVYPSIIIASPLVLYAAASFYLKVCINQSEEGQQALDVGDLVPSEIASDEDFERFVATWLTLRLRMGSSLEELLADNLGQGGDNDLRESLKMPSTDHINAFVDWSEFVEALPSTEGAKVTLEMAQQQPPALLGGGSRLFGMSVDTSVIRVANLSAEQNLGFNILVGRCSDEKKRVLLIRCRTQGRDPTETFTADNLEQTLRQTLVNAEDLIREGWEVSLVVLASCQTSMNVIPWCRALEPSPDDHYIIYRTGVIGNKAALRDLFGASFGLAFELAQDTRFQGR